jgi:hypothetical protein
MLNGSAKTMSRERLREIKQLKKDDISDTHKSTDQSRPTIVVGIKDSEALEKITKRNPRASFYPLAFV